jgi:hypothetical protein
LYFHSSLLDRMVCSHLIFCWTDSLFTPYVMSSMNPNAKTGALGISSSSALYVINKIGDSGDPCGIPASISMLLDVTLLNRNCVIQSIRALY